MLQHYGRIDELGGLDVTITTVDETGEAVPDSGLEKWLTIEEWQVELGRADL